MSVVTASAPVSAEGSGPAHGLRRWLAPLLAFWQESRRPDALALIVSESPYWETVMPTQIVVTEFMDEAVVAELAANFDVVYDPSLVERPADWLAQARHAQALIVRNRTQVTRCVIDNLPALKVVGRLGVGLDNIDLAACEARGIRVIPATGANAQAVAEYVITTALLLLRGAYFASAAVAGGQWPRPALSSGREIAGKQLGLIGFGAIGRLVARLAQGLGMRVVAFDPQLASDDPVWASAGVQPRALQAVLGESDVISLHVPLTPGTRHLIDAERIAAIKRGAVLINTARGGVVDEAALAAALKTGQLGGAALDVFDAEPLPAHSVLDGAPNLILTPHIAGLSEEANVRVSALIGQRVAQVLRGEEV